MDILKVFSKNVKKYRTAMGVSQEAFAELCGLHRTYISAIISESKSNLGNRRKIWIASCVQQ